MRITDVFVPIRTLLMIGWFLFLCIVAPTLAAVLLLGGTGYAVYESINSKEQPKGRSNGKSNFQKRPEYPG